MRMAAVDWLVILAYLVFALGVGVVFARRAGKSVDEYFLSGRSLPWWMAGTSMVATSFAADTPLLISGWVRSEGIWKNWAWWCFAISGTFQVFLFARWWRRGGLMTKAELAELRYGDREAGLLRAFLGCLHAGVTNTLVLCWVLLAASKISEVLFGVDKLWGLTLACLVALSYALLAGFWGVVVTDMVQFAMAMVGAVFLAWVSWDALGGGPGLAQAIDQGLFPAERLAILPGPDPASGSTWTTALAGLAVYLGVSWWAVENVDGSGIAVQRISAARDEREGMLAVLWFNVSHYALRPWCWILVGVASLVVLPPMEVRAPVAGRVVEVRDDGIEIETSAGRLPIPLEHEDSQGDWMALSTVALGESVEANQIVARTDEERAYVVMMARFLPAGLLGLVAASLLAAFMSTIDTHVNLASSFFINDIYRRFLRPGASARHYVQVARVASTVVLLAAGLLAWNATSISGLFLFFLAFLSGVGPVYVLRWFWWRVRASTEIVAMASSALAATLLTLWDIEWNLGPLSPGGTLAPEGRLVLVVIVSMTCSALALLLGSKPDPAKLVPFYERIRPIGLWGPVRSLAQVEAAPRDTGLSVLGSLAGLALVYGLLFGLGAVFLGSGPQAGAFGLCALLGALALRWILPRLEAPR